jgi:hypothetical protein
MYKRRKELLRNKLKGIDWLYTHSFK